MRPDKSNNDKTDVFSKVPEVTLLFWIIKMAATTLGETAGDVVSMSMRLPTLRIALWALVMPVVPHCYWHCF